MSSRQRKGQQSQAQRTSECHCCQYVFSSSSSEGENACLPGIGPFGEDRGYKIAGLFLLAYAFALLSHAEPAKKDPATPRPR